MNQFADRQPSSGAAPVSGDPASTRAAASRDSLEQSLREMIRRFDSERSASRGAFAKEIAAIASQEMTAATERLRSQSDMIVGSAETKSQDSIEAMQGELEKRIDSTLLERRTDLDERLAEAERELIERFAGVEQALAKRVEAEMATAVGRAELNVREQTQESTEAASAQMGEKFSSIIEREMKSALERQSAAVAAATLHHRRALEKMITDQKSAIAAALEKSLAESLDRRLGEIQSVIDSQVTERAAGFESTLQGELGRVKQELVASNSESVVRIGAQLAEVTETKQGEMAEKYEHALSSHRVDLAEAAEAQLRDRTDQLEVAASEQLAALQQSVSERMAAAESRIAASSASAVAESRSGFDDDLSLMREELSVEHRSALAEATSTIAAQAEKVATELAVRAEQDRIELGSRIESRVREARDELQRSNADAIAAAEQRTLVDGGAAVNKLVAEAIVGAEARLGGRVDSIRSELTGEFGSASSRLADEFGEARSQVTSELGAMRAELTDEVQTLRSELTREAEASATAIGQHVDSEVSIRISEARAQLENDVNRSVEAGREQLEAGLSQQLIDQVAARSQELRQSLKAETDSLLNDQMSQLRQEADVRARDGEQLAISAATDASRAELAAKVDGELQRLAQGNELKLGDHEKRVGLLVSQAQSEIDAAREQIVSTSVGLERRARRHEHKLIKAEASSRVQKALQGVEVKAAAIEADAARATERLDASKAQLQETEGRISNALTQVDTDTGELGVRAEQALARLEKAIGDVEGSRSRVLEVERRVGETELQVRRVGELNDQASAVELRIRRATEAEADAAEKIFEAERRLTSLTDQ